MQTFYLGTHHPGWLWQHPQAGPLFVSHKRLQGYARLRRARCRWALDSGGFTELSKRGAWSFTAMEYVAAVRRYSAGIRKLDWAAPMDWMCEPAVLAMTGLTVREHQARTIESVQTLRALAPELPFIPVLQGWTLDDYLDCIDLYGDAGIDLRAEPVVGVGSVCRRQATSEIAEIVHALAGAGLALHAFGVKTTGLANFADAVVSTDSMAWSFAARKRPPLPECVGRHINCANCIRYAKRWRRDLLRA